MHEPDSENLVAIGLNDLRSCGWREAIASAGRADYPRIWTALLAAAQRATEEGRLVDARALRLLANACSMMLQPASPNEPFGPLMVMDGRRTALPDDFSPEDVGLFTQMIEEVDNPWLLARLADLVWLLSNPRNHKAALVAIDAYRQMPLDATTWAASARDCRQRALQLTRMLGVGAADRLHEMETEILATLTASGQEGGSFFLCLVDLLFESGLGRSAQTEITLKLKMSAAEAGTQGDAHRARECLEAAAKWYERAGDEVEAAATTAALAESWAKEASSQMSGDSRSHLAAVAWLENAIKAFRRVPRKYRDAFGVNERIAELRQLRAQAGEGSLGEMALISSPGIDISQLVDAARAAVSGKALPEALGAFAKIYAGASFARLRQSAVESIRRHPLQALITATVMSSDGRVVAKRPGMGSDENEPAGQEAVIWAETLKDYGIEVALVVQGSVWPALRQLTLEHRVTARDLIAVANGSPAVPPEREPLFAKGLAAGFDCDFVTALHLLVPQIEHLVRWHLKQHGVTTTLLDADGIDNEFGLGALLEKPEASEILGEDLAFELRALFTDPLGPNLRNDIAHGLMELAAAQSTFGIYAWWWCFRLVFQTFLRAAARDVSGGESTDSSPEGANGTSPT